MIYGHWVSLSDIVLDWADNTDEDFTAYNIYRSTDSGSGYTLLNSTPLTSSTYTDTPPSIATMYYYVVTALDSSDNESEYSVEACGVMNASTGTTIVIQENATGFCGVDGSVDTEEHSGYTGYGYCDTENDSSSYIDWKHQYSFSRKHIQFTLRYANGSSDRTARLLVNNAEVVSTINMAATGAWETWADLAFSVSLSAGPNAVRLQSTNSSGCGNVELHTNIWTFSSNTSL